MKLSKEQAKFKNRTTWAYVAFIFQTFFKRPFGYIVAALYVIYLAVILLIVPAAIHFDPLFIWSNAAFNIPIFNLFFIAAASGALAVAVFRTGRDDGTELTLSAKPITKNIRVFGKTFVYLAVMLGFCAIITGLVALVYPVFGEYNLFTNPTGITMEKYVGLILSILIGNIVNMLLFGGISVLISMVGGQVITIVASVGIAFLMCLLNVIFPIAVSSPLDVLRNKYNTSINSMVANTRSQVNKSEKESNVSNFAAIQCITEQTGEEIAHYDTYEYWNKANNESGIKGTNYVDFGKQLSYLYSAFGVDEAKLLSASKLMIGATASNYYTIDKDTCISSQANKELYNYPISIYTLETDQGISYPQVIVLGGDLDLSENWYLITQITKADWNAVCVESKKSNGFTLNINNKSLVNKNWFRLSDLTLSQKEYEYCQLTFDYLISSWIVKGYDEPYTKVETPGEADNIAINVIVDHHDEAPDTFWEGDFFKLSLDKQFEIVAKIQLGWTLMAQDWQIDMIDLYCQLMGIQDSFPYTSKTVKAWYNDTVLDETGQKHINYFVQKHIENIFKSSINVHKDLEKNEILYPKMPTKTLDYCETYNNLYKYRVTSFYDVNVLIIIWTCLSIGLFTTSVIVYKRTDFK